MVPTKFYIFLPALALALLNNGGIAMAGTTYSFEPKEFEMLIEDRSDEDRLQFYHTARQHSLVVPFPGLERTTPNAMVMNMPEKLIIRADGLNDFSWEEVQLPLTFSAMFDGNHARFKTSQFVFMKDERSGQEFSFWANVDLLDRSRIPTLIRPLYNVAARRQNEFLWSYSSSFRHFFSLKGIFMPFSGKIRPDFCFLAKFWRSYPIKPGRNKARFRL